MSADEMTNYGLTMLAVLLGAILLTLLVNEVMKARQQRQQDEREAIRARLNSDLRGFRYQPTRQAVGDGWTLPVSPAPARPQPTTPTTGASPASIFRIREVTADGQPLWPADKPNSDASKDLPFTREEIARRAQLCVDLRYSPGVLAEVLDMADVRERYGPGANFSMAWRYGDERAQQERQEDAG